MLSSAFTPGRGGAFRQAQNASAPGRSTDELLELLENCDQLSPVLEELTGELNAPSFCRQLEDLMARRQVNAARLSELALMSRSFTYQICSGDRRPSRDIVLRLALVLGLSLDETQRLLCAAGKGKLYPRVRRDAVLIFALKKNLDILAADELLIAQGETPLV